ncbi:hypothetical protein SteCoe_29612 [Stentor coeruleus]|uniref:Uncharacterized protein n=1 Tax=Stentor coeruleus TaxID=5963 RepID=A0A1R2B5X2_9CILI|nr:hypothetical protein SteCoe_29612 [Stentor coeruleus]
MNRANAIGIKAMSNTRNKGKDKKGVEKSLKLYEAIVRIQRWWRKASKKLKNPFKMPARVSGFKVNMKNRNVAMDYNPEAYLEKRISKIPLEFEESFNEKSQQDVKGEVYEDSLQSSFLNASMQSRTAELMNYLEESERKNKPKVEMTENYNSQAAILNYRMELEESLKTIDTLKLVIQRLKKEQLECQEEHKKSLEASLETQRTEYEEISLKNMSFIEQLLSEKQQRISQLTELNTKIKEMEIKHQKALQELREQSQRELKKQKDAWVTSEKSKRTNWMKEKTKEIKENTTKNLEPEIMRILAENKRAIEKLKEEQVLENRVYKEQIENEYENKLSDFKDELKGKYDEMLEKEREGYQEKLRDLHLKQEEELMNMRKRWNEDMGCEKQKLHELRMREENSYQEKIGFLKMDYEKKIEEVVGKYKSYIEELEIKHENRLKKLKSEVAIEKEEWIGSQMAKMTKEFDDKKEQMKIELVQNRDKELKIVISKLSEEKIKHKKKLEKDSESKLKLLQEKHNTEISEYEKIIENLKDKIDKSTNVRRNLDDNFQTLLKKIQDQEQQIQKLENDNQRLKDTISNLQFKIDNFKEDQSEAIEEARKEESRKQSTLQQELDITKEQINLLKDKYEEKLAQFAQKEAEEFEAIEARVKTTIMRKDEKIREIQEELQLSKLKVLNLKNY